MGVGFCFRSLLSSQLLSELLLLVFHGFVMMLYKSTLANLYLSSVCGINYEVAVKEQIELCQNDSAFEFMYNVITMEDCLCGERRHRESSVCGIDYEVEVEEQIESCQNSDVITGAIVCW